MEMPAAPSQRKRVRFPYTDEANDQGEDEAPKVKKPRFPKGKKDSQRESSGKSLGLVDGEEDDFIVSTDPRVAALERATRRDRVAEQMLAEEIAVPADVAIAEEDYHEEDEERIEDDGMRIEPFNLKQEREEGYFDAEGNYVEYRNDDDTKDAWLESVEGTRLAGNVAAPQPADDSDGEKDLSNQEIAAIKRRIADSLQPGETVLGALRRLKGMSKGERRMGGDTKAVFDRLTEDTMRLLENGDYNVYEEKKETFQREAEGYEALLGLSSGSNGSSASAGESCRSDLVDHSDMFADLQEDVVENGVSSSNGYQVSSASDSGVDIFGDDDAGEKSENGWASSVQQEGSTVPLGVVPGEDSGYVYDEISGYYYNKELDYYYDVNSGLYCCAGTNQWYKFDEEKNVYEEVTQYAEVTQL